MLHAQRLVQTLPRPGEQGAEPSVRPLHLQQGRKLALAPRTAAIDHQLLGRALGDGLAQVLGDQGQGQVYAGGDPRRGPDRAVANEDAVRFDPDPRIAAGDVGGAAPVGGRPAAVQHPGLGQDIGSRTDAGHAPRAGRRGADEGDGRRVGGGAAGAVAARDHQGVEGGRVGERHRIQACARRTGHRPGLGRQHAQVIGARAKSAADLEGRQGAGGVEQLKVGKDQETNGSRHGGFRGNLVICARP